MELTPWAPWQLCDCCEDYICNIHPGYHVADCDCPPIEYWCNAGFLPYYQCRQDDLAAFTKTFDDLKPDWND